MRVYMAKVKDPRGHSEWSVRYVEYPTYDPTGAKGSLEHTVELYRSRWWLKAYWKMKAIRRQVLYASAGLDA